MPLISQMVKDSLVTQWGMEMYNANIYLYIASFLKSKGLDNMAKFFEKQRDDELSHANIIYQLLSDLNETIIIPEIDGFSDEINGLDDIGQIYLSRETDTTNSLKEIMQQASDESMGGCPIVQVRMIEMLKEQQEELALATTTNDRFSVIGNDWKFAVILDSNFG